MTQQQIHLLENRKRRIPRRIRQVQAEIKSIDQRVAFIEDAKEISAEGKATMIKSLRQSCAPLNYSLRRLVDRGNELGLRIAA